MSDTVIAALLGSLIPTIGSIFAVVLTSQKQAAIQSERMDQFREELKAIKEQMEKLQDVVVRIAKLETRIEILEKRIEKTEGKT